LPDDALTLAKPVGSVFLTSLGAALITSSTQTPIFFSTGIPGVVSEKAGFRLASGGVHTSRTMMLDELRSTLASVPVSADHSTYLSAIIEDNCARKSTAATRKLTASRLSDLYALDNKVPMFRALRSLWDVSTEGQPLLALLIALSRDPRLLMTAPVIIAIHEGSELHREPMTATLRAADGGRLSPSILDKVVRNAASSWSQAGHLVGRTFKKRYRVDATPAVASLAAYLAWHAGLRGTEIFRSGWFQVIDASPTKARALLLEAKQIGLIDLRIAGDVITMSFERIDGLSERK
jgi:hypothetical protein